MRTTKLRNLLNAIGHEVVDQIGFIDLNQEITLKLKTSGGVNSNGTCSSNSGCVQNTTCSGNTQCSGNGVCNHGCI